MLVRASITWAIICIRRSMRESCRVWVGKHFTAEDVQRLNDELPDMIKQKHTTHTVVNLFYSEKDAPIENISRI